MRDLALLANPNSGDGDAANAAERLRALGAGVREFAVGAEDDAASCGADALVIAGGDGSIAPAALAASRAGLPLAVLPAGTANDFARAHELPDEIGSACELAVRGERTIALDIGLLGDRPFLNVASLGLPPAAARRAQGLKGALGPLAYAVGALRAGLGAQPVRCSARCDGEEVFAGEAWQLTVACSGAFGSGSSVDADPSDGLLDVVAVTAGPRLELVRRAYGLRLGRIEAQSGVSSASGAEVVVEAPGGTSFNVDGELVEAGGAEFTIMPAALLLLVG